MKQAEKISYGAADWKELDLPLRLDHELHTVSCLEVKMLSNLIGDADQAFVRYGAGRHS